MKHVAFLRGINVGGKNKIKMEALRETFAALGFTEVKTYINSGNVVFETVETNDKDTAARIESAVEADFALKIKVITRRLHEIEALIAENPFAGQFETDKDLHVFFLDEPLPLDKVAVLLASQTETEQFAVRGREIFCLLRINASDSLMGKGFIEKKLKVAATARNFRTVKKIAEFQNQ